MASIAHLALDTTADWADVTSLAHAWAGERGVDIRSMVVLVPFAQHLPLARRAWARWGGWQPRIETTRTLAASLGPLPRAGDSQITFDASIDRLHAARMLRSQSWVPRDPLMFDEAVSALVVTAHALLKAASAVEPTQRAAHWDKGRELLLPTVSVGAMERGLARLALEWAALAPSAATDALFALRPGAWVAVQAGGEDALVQRLMTAMPSSVPCLVLDGDFGARSALSGVVSLVRCEAFEAEAASAAAQVLAHLRDGREPVALVAQDRLLMRRVRALLERQGVGLQDETGWKLSTTRAAAQVMTLLRAAGPQASTDLLLDWLKSGTWPHASTAIAEIESACRREGWSRAASIRPEVLREGTAAFHAEAVAVLQGFTAARRQPLAQWLIGLRMALERSHMLVSLETDEAGIEVLRTLHLEDPSAWAAQPVAQALMSLADFTAWVDAALEDASFIPEPAPDASVVITPLARMMLRPFAAVVFPGADDRHLGVDAGPHPLLNDAQALALGVPTPSQRREAEVLAFAHATSRAPVSFFYRRADGAEPLSASPLLERLALRLAAAGRAFVPWTDPRLVQAVPRTPVVMPSPGAPSLLPQRISASACEALRACPYRFYALYLLRLREADELGDEIEQRDYGNWLHAVLMKFHEQRGSPASLEVECARLLAVAREEKALLGLDDADFLPFEAGFEDLAPRYITWLHERDAQGAHWWQGEQDKETAPPGWEGMRLQGRIDRIDRVDPIAPGHGAHSAPLELIDYKTGSAQALKDKLRQPFEDTQLAFYAALMLQETDRPLQASYLTLGRKIESLMHPRVEESAHALVAGVGADMARIRRGAGMPALGEPPTCDFCEARGLCRRDHWTTPE